MSDSNRSEVSGNRWVKPVLITVGIFVLTVLIAAITANLSIRKEAQENANAIEAYSNRYTVERCTRFYPVEANECIKEATQAAANQQRDEADLYAQRQMGIWAVVVAVCAAITIPLSLAGIYFLHANLDEMKKGRSLTEKAVDAAKTANELTRASKRAWLNFEITHFVESRSNGEFGVHLNSVVDCIGETPALKVGIDIFRFQSEGSIVLNDIVYVAKEEAIRKSNVIRSVILPGKGIELHKAPEMKFIPTTIDVGGAKGDRTHIVYVVVVTYSSPVVAGRFYNAKVVSPKLYASGIGHISGADAAMMN